VEIFSLLELNLEIETEIEMSIECSIDMSIEREPDGIQISRTIIC
jgi:hypothetical protein